MGEEKESILRPDALAAIYHKVVGGMVDAADIAIDEVCRNNPTAKKLFKKLLTVGEEMALEKIPLKQRGILKVSKPELPASVEDMDVKAEEKQVITDSTRDTRMRD